jgi:translation initiation factor 1
MSKKEKNRIGVVYSTNPEFNYELDNGEQIDTLPSSKQILRVQLDRKQRIEDCEALGKILKQKCGVGGSVKDNEIILQGDHRTKVLALLQAEGYNQTKISGG